MSEPAILVKRKMRNSQIWTMEKLENKIIDMREMYEERKATGQPMMVEDPIDELDGSNWVCAPSAAWLVLLFLMFRYKRIISGCSMYYGLTLSVADSLN